MNRHEPIYLVELPSGNVAGLRHDDVAGPAFFVTREVAKQHANQCGGKLVKMKSTPVLEQTAYNLIMQGNEYAVMVEPGDTDDSVALGKFYLGQIARNHSISV